MSAAAVPADEPGNRLPIATYPSIPRRLAAMVYEGLLVLALILVASLLFYGAATSRLEGLQRVAFQAYLFVVIGVYFVWCWRRGSQTLAMKAWKLRVVTAAGTRIELGRAIARFLLAAATIGTGVLAVIVLWKRPHALGAWLALAPAVATVLWALVDRDKQFLHDRLAGTRLVVTSREGVKSREGRREKGEG